jgi:type I restriction enzyme R subunit
VAFFQAVRAVLAKSTPGDRKTDEELDLAIRQIISKAVVSEEVVDIFAAAGLKKPDISILSDEFLADIQGMPQRNLAVELLQKLLTGEIRAQGKRNVVQARSFAELLDQAVRKYQNRAIEMAQVIEELIQLAKDMRAAKARGDQLGLSEDELAFYDALETNDSAVKVLGDDALRAIARELVETVRKNVTIDWTIRENVQAQLRVLVKRILRKHGYLPESLIADVPRIVAGLQVGQSFKAIPVPDPPVIRRGAGGHFHDKGLEGASHHAIVPNVNTVDTLRGMAASVAR